jgi:hypothetical protein
MDWLLGTLKGQLVSLLMVAGVGVMGSAIVWVAVGNNEEAEVEDESREWHAALWFAWALWFDPGTQTGLSGYAATGILTAAAAISCLGFLFNLTMLGFIVDRIREILDELKEIYGREVHVCGLCMC